MKRGDLVTAVLGRDYGKPRPAIVVQADICLELPLITVVPLTSHSLPLSGLRILLEPSPANGLRQTSRVMIDKINTIPERKLVLLSATCPMTTWTGLTALSPFSSDLPDIRRYCP
ncbi:type II toxin-antitoxin system PemK/MazF family toxin [Tardiphaga alba]|uniref:type II toxin-antitoxin system PemK/MazF family toxin n=1 Tax=Tardiphaga alba TaxID=340268 RepID=UPI0020135B98|nr:type II toxin-antitoxin system PemK/MazF family toxin [Tardiphaga alba]